MTFQHALHQIFYGVNKFDKREDITKCRQYMLMKENVENWQQRQQSPQLPSHIEHPQQILHQEDAEITQVKPSAMSVYYPKHANSFFWCVYIGAYGMSEYLMHGNKITNTEMNERQKMFDYFRDSSNTNKLKQGNIKVTNVLIQEIMADIMVSTRDPNSVFHMFIALSVFHKKTIYFVRKNKYIVFSYFKYENELEDLDIESTLLIYAKNDKECGLCEEPTIENITDIVENKYRLESYNKPLRGISSYKVSELENIARKLNVDLCDAHGDPIKKQELYNKIVNHATW